MPLPRLAAAAALAVLSLSAPAAAEPAAHGLYAEGGIGAAAFIGPNAPYARVGPSFGLRLGWDLFSWLAIGAHLSGSTHQAEVPPPPDKEYFQIYNAHAEGRINLQVWRLELYADGGAGLSMISSNVLEKVGVLDPGERFTLSFAAGGGMEYHIVNRHYAFGASGQWMLLPEFDAMSTVTMRAYMRYSY